MSLFPLKSTSTYVKAYYAALKQFHEHGHITEGNTRAAFADLLKRCASPYDWHLVEEYQFKGANKHPPPHRPGHHGSLETQQIIASLPTLGFGQTGA
jgi:hypothetical protein